jgi:hypothetical protein
MKIVTSAESLDLSGVPTFALTMYQELVQRGHEVIVYSPLGGRLELEMKSAKTTAEIPKPDIVLAQGATCATALRKAFPSTPLIFYSHGLLPELEQPPQIQIDYYLAINEEVQKNLRDKGVPASKISIVRDFIDTERFISTKPLHRKIKEVLFISNYKKWKNFKTVDAACKKLGVKLTCRGSTYGRDYQIEKSINRADLVISWGRGILEAMACGRAALSFDRFEGDGYITPETYLKARQNNFSGRIFRYAFTAETLAREMLKYDSHCARVNRDLIMKYHHAKRGVDQILECFRKI